MKQIMNKKPLTIQPIPYQGSKRNLAPYICHFFSSNIHTLYEPFAGSAAVTLFAAQYKLARQFVIGDIHEELIDLWDLIINHPSKLAQEYEKIWKAQFIFGENHFNNVRKQYNADRNAVHLLYLIVRCVKNAIRFNKNGDFTQSVDKRRTGMRPEKMYENAHSVSKLLQGKTLLFKGDFRECMKYSQSNDLVYCDPPYQGTTYGKDKRYNKQLDTGLLIEALEDLNMRGIPYILSYDGKCGEKTYGALLPNSINAKHHFINAGRSSQSTLVGGQDITYESIYLSRCKDLEKFDIFIEKSQFNNDFQNFLDVF